MQINIKATELDLTPALKVYIEQKMGVIARLLKRFEASGQPELWLEVARTTHHHRRGEVFMAEADLRLPGKVLRAKHEDVNIRTAIDELQVKLRLEIDKYKTRKVDRVRRVRAKEKSGK
ncbi:MAG: ribosome-associated translation inhibitor RaiA [Candidatus Liptonbacteria bacterium]